MADHDDDVFEETSPIEPSHPESDTAPIEESSIDQQKVYILNISTGYKMLRVNITNIMHDLQQVYLLAGWSSYEKRFNKRR